MLPARRLPPSAPALRCGQGQQKTPPSYTAGPGSGRSPAALQPQPPLSPLPRRPEVRRRRATPVRAPFPSGRGHSLEETSGHWFPARPAS